MDRDFRMENVSYLKSENTVQDMLTHPALAEFSRHMLPRKEDAASNISIKNIGRLIPWHSHVRPEIVLSGINRLISDSSAGKPVFYHYYTNPIKTEQTGLFFFRGKPDAPFALICPGGGFRYVGSLHEGFPIAEIISAHGFNAFVLQYRTGGEKIACEDMAHALSWIFHNAESLAVSVKGYSVWGGSAGARMAADLGSYGSSRLGGDDLPKPAAVIMAYTGHDWITREDPPTFSVVSSDDPIASANVMIQRTLALKDAGIDAEIRVFNNAGHGFGIGTGTDAEGWIDEALRFWERQLVKEKTFRGKNVE
ncbi:MAG: alpha/beta hydrolase [Desulfovibrio sp.]|nr:alpha/beta hydrolase [Desulfovibrio sp.]